MFKRLFEMAKQLLTMTEETQNNKAEIKELRQEIRSLTEVVQRLVYEIHRVGERDEHERDKIKLWLETNSSGSSGDCPPSDKAKGRTIRSELNGAFCGAPSASDDRHQDGEREIDRVARKAKRAGDFDYEEQRINQEKSKRNCEPSYDNQCEPDRARRPSTRQKRDQRYVIDNSQQ